MKVMFLSIAGLLIMGTGLGRAQGTPPAAGEKKPWELTLAAGASLNSGNSDTRLSSASVFYEYKGPLHEFLFSADTAYGTDKGNTTVDNSYGKAAYHYRFTEPVYALADVTAGRDSIAAVQYRFIASPGLGLYVVKNAAESLDLEAGPGYLVERKGGMDDNAATVRVAERGEWQAMPTSKVWEYVEYVPHLDDSSQYIVTAEFGVQSAITTLLNVRLMLRDIYDSTPAPDRKSNDVSFLAALAIEL